MIIKIESSLGDVRITGNQLTFEQIKKLAVLLFKSEDDEHFIPTFCIGAGYKELPYFDGYEDYIIDLSSHLVFVTPSTFPKELDHAKVLYHTERGVFEPVYYFGGEEIADRVFYLAICKYDNDSSYYIFHIDENLEVVADDCFDTLDACKKCYDAKWLKHKSIGDPI